MRLTDDKTAKALKEISDKLKAGGFEVDVSNERYIKLAEYEQTGLEPEQIRKGRWIHVAGMNSKCSCCGNYFPAKEFEQRPFDVNYCIWCGARMDGEPDEE